MTPRVFKKRYPKNSVSLSNGKFVSFEDVGFETGFHVTDDPAVIAEFEACMKRGAGGIQNSTIDEYQEAIKKKTTSPGLKASLLREVQTAGLVTIPEVPVAVVSPVAVVDSAEPTKLDLPPIGSPEPKVGKKPAK